MKLYLPVDVALQYGLQMPISLLRADNNLPPWRSGLKEVNSFTPFFFSFPFSFGDFSSQLESLSSLGPEFVCLIPMGVCFYL